MFPNSFTDQMGHIISLPEKPVRIVSLVPSQTELLFSLGLTDEVVGITKFCVHPDEMFRSKVRIGGTKQINSDKIHELKPDLIIGNKEENEKNQIEYLGDLYPLWMSDIANLGDALNMIAEVGALVGKPEEAEGLVNKISSGFDNLTRIIKPSNKRTAYFIWKNPYMTAASGTFINEMLEVCGYKNAFSHMSRYPAVSEEMIKKAEPEQILLSSEPYPFKDKHIDEFKKLCPGVEVKIVDGEMFSWYGSRLIHAIEYFKQLTTA